MAGLPNGTVTFLFTDLADSTRLWEDHPEAMRAALARHDEILRAAIAASGGVVVKTTGDGAHAVFATAAEAIDAAVDAQRMLTRESWDESTPLLVRMGLHTGTAEVRDGDYYGTDVNRAARLMGLAHGGQVVCSQATADLARAGADDGWGVVDLGLHPLRGLQQPVRVFQISHADVADDFPPLRTLDAFPGNLPVQVTEFVGRDEELAQIVPLLARSRVVTLTGSGGVGKTRLAVRSAAEAVPDYADGAWFVDLAAVDDEVFVPSAIATAMGLPERRQGTSEEALAGVLGRREALVVLDNCEHLVDAVARVVELVVQRCPGITVLATSQEGLGVSGEATYVVRPLSDPDAVRLFVERASAARHGFTLSAEQDAVVHELCRRLDGIPLAIELAAARVASMSPTTILDRLDERFRLLGQGRRTARRRHQTLRAAVDWSYGLLEPEEQLAFARLAVFAGDFTLPAAEAVVAADDIDVLDVVDIVSGLVAKSMVQLDERADTDSYRLLETMRDYGLERLGEDGTLESVQQRHAAFCVAFAEDAIPRLVGAEDIAWLQRITDEMPNLRAALAFLQEQDPPRFVSLVSLLAEYWMLDAHFREGLAWLTAAFTAVDAPMPRRAERLADAANLATILDRYDEGRALVDESLACAEAAGEPPPWTAFQALGLAALVHNRNEDAFRFGEEAIALARAAGDPYDLGMALATASSALGMSSEDTFGIALADEAVEIARSLGSQVLLLLALRAAGINRSRVDPVRAVEILEEVFTLPAARFHQGGFAYTWKAVAHVNLREYASAARELGLALPALQEGGELYQQSIALAVAASVLRRADPHTAVRLLGAIARLRDDGRLIGAAGDLAVQTYLADRLRDALDAAEFDTAWDTGHALTLDDATALALERLVGVTDRR